MVRFKIGDKVVITACHHGHRFYIGDVVTITGISDQRSYYKGRNEKGECWSFNDKECKGYIE